MIDSYDIKMTSSCHALLIDRHSSHATKLYEWLSCSPVICAAINTAIDTHTEHIDATVLSLLSAVFYYIPAHLCG